MIVSLHVATGGGVALLARSRPAALLLGPLVHVAGDQVPHQDIHDRRFEVASGVVCVALLAVRRGPLDRVTLGAASCSAPDLEHLFGWLRPGGRKLFHRGPGGHSPFGGIPSSVQLLLAGAIVGFLLGPSRVSPGSPPATGGPPGA